MRKLPALSYMTTELIKSAPFGVKAEIVGVPVPPGPSVDAVLEVGAPCSIIEGDRFAEIHDRVAHPGNIVGGRFRDCD